MRNRPTSVYFSGYCISWFGSTRLSSVFFVQFLQQGLKLRSSRSASNRPLRATVGQNSSSIQMASACHVCAAVRGPQRPIGLWSRWTKLISSKFLVHKLKKRRKVFSVKIFFFKRWIILMNCFLQHQKVYIWKIFSQFRHPKKVLKPHTDWVFSDFDHLHQLTSISFTPLLTATQKKDLPKS